MANPGRALQFPAGRPRRKEAATGAASFEELVVNLSRTFVRVSVDQIDQEINHWLEHIGLALDLDRSTIAEINARSGWAGFSHGWARDPSRVITNSLDASTLLPWVKGKMLAGETVVMPSPDDLPDEAAVDRETFRRFGPKSNVMVPIKVGGVVVAAMGFGALYRERSWPARIVKRFQTVAEIFGYAFERKRADTEIAELRSELMHVSRVTTMGELAAALTHELSQPLSAVQINAETAQLMLESDQPDLGKARATVADIILDNNRAADIIRRLRPLFRRERGASSEFDPVEALDEVGKIVQGDARIRKISFALEVRRPLAPLFGERIQLQQAIINLVLNAFDAAAEPESTARRVSLSAIPGPENSVKIFVRNSGKGIEPEVMQRIFDPFFTTKATGMGMGLSISRTIIQSHGGRLSVSSEPGNGTTFEVELPSHPQATA